MDELDWKVLRIIGYVIASPILIPFWTVRWIWSALQSVAEAAAQRIRDEQLRRQRQIDEAARRNERERNAAESRRRDAARVRCELVYALHAPDLRKLFSGESFRDFLRRHMGDDRSPEEVEERAEQLIALLEQHRHRLDPLLRFRNLEDLAWWFSEQKHQMDTIPDDRLKRTMLAQLNARYAELTAPLMEEHRL